MYLGSVLSNTCLLYAKIDARVRQASTAFRQLQKRIFTNIDLTIATKVAVYKAVCILNVKPGQSTVLILKYLLVLVVDERDSFSAIDAHIFPCLVQTVLEDVD